VARYWVGGSGNWDYSDTTHWSDSDGGAGGQSVPTVTDDVFFTSLSGSANYTVAASYQMYCNNLTIGAPSSGKVTIQEPSGYTLYIYSSLTITGGTSGVAITIVGKVYFYSASLGNTIATSGVVFPNITQMDFNSGGNDNCGYTLQDDLTIGGFLSFNPKTTFYANNHNVKCAHVEVYGFGGATYIHMGSGTWELTTVASGKSWYCFYAPTIYCDTSTIKITDTTNADVVFAGDSFTYYNIWFARGASTGNIIISALAGGAQSNTFHDFKDTGTVAHSIWFFHGSTTHVTTFTVTGSSGKLVTINSCTYSSGFSATTTTHALVKSGGGTISCGYLSVQHSVATPTNTWYAGTTSTNNQAVATAGSGWTFTAPITTNIKTLDGLANASVKTSNGLARASVKTIDGLA